MIRQGPKTLVQPILLGLTLVSGVAGCGDETPTTGTRGLGGLGKKGGGGPAPNQPGAPQPGAGGGEGGDERPKTVLTREDFASVTRDPFESFIGTQIVELEPDRPRAQRDVKMAEYNFEDLNLVAIVHSGRNIVPRALFVSSDGKSKAIKQGEYFSRAEVLLASVNRDYVEVEVVDETLSANLNLARGERRAIYLKND